MEQKQTEEGLLTWSWDDGLRVYGALGPESRGLGQELESSGHYLQHS